MRQRKEPFPFPSNCLEQASLQGVSATAGSRSQNNNLLSVIRTHMHWQVVFGWLQASVLDTFVYVRVTH